jgi:hypothetical protein
MNRNDFLKLMEDQESCNPLLLGEFNELISIFPYFQSAHMLLLRGLNLNEDVRFSSQLRNSALYIADREVLYNLLNKPVKVKEVTEEAIQPSDILQSHDDNGSDNATLNAAEITPVVEVVTPDAAGITPDASEEIMPSQAVETEAAPVTLVESDTEKEQTVIDIAKNSDEIISEIEKEAEPASEEVETIDEEATLAVIEGPEEIISDTETEAALPEGQEADLLEIETERVNFSDDIDPEPDTRPTQADLIERFIILNPRIEPIREKKEVPVEDRSVPVYDESGFVTETLARIYIGQGYYSKAIDIFEKLTLKFPEKSSYFAAQIEKVKEYLKK